MLVDRHQENNLAPRALLAFAYDAEMNGQRPELLPVQVALLASAVQKWARTLRDVDAAPRSGLDSMAKHRGLEGLDEQADLFTSLAAKLADFRGAPVGTGAFTYAELKLCLEVVDAQCRNAARLSYHGEARMYGRLATKLSRMASYIAP